MSYENQQSCLKFSIEESVWFQKGQEVSELVSIALDPDISIQEREQYITIRGALQLTGEYRIHDSGTQSDTFVFPDARMVNEVLTREDGISEITHRFPVDITIPKNRIENLDEVFVSIDMFDYELPERHILQLTADLSISGIYGSQQSLPKVEEESGEPARVEHVPTGEQREEEQYTPAAQATQQETAPEPEQALTETRPLAETPVTEQAKVAPQAPLWEEITPIENSAEQRPVSEEKTESVQEKQNFDELSEYPQSAVREEIIKSEKEAEPELTAKAEPAPLVQDTVVQGTARWEPEEKTAAEPAPELKATQAEQKSAQVPPLQSREKKPVEEPAAFRKEAAPEFFSFTIEPEKEVENLYRNTPDDSGDDFPNGNTLEDNTSYPLEDGADVYLPFEIEARREIYQEDTAVPDRLEEELRPVASENQTPQIGMKGRSEEEEKWKIHQLDKIQKQAAQVAEQQPQAEKEQKPVAAGRRNENALYLTKIFTKEQVDDFSRLKICIVQQGETLDAIADRYDVNLQQLLRVNQMSGEQDIYAGQLLYIPVLVNS